MWFHLDQRFPPAPGCVLAVCRGAVAALAPLKGTAFLGPASVPEKQQLLSLWLGDSLLCLCWNVFPTLKYFYIFAMHSSGPDTGLNSRKSAGLREEGCGEGCVRLAGAVCWPLVSSWLQCVRERVGPVLFGALSAPAPLTGPSLCGQARSVPSPRALCCGSDCRPECGWHVSGVSCLNCHLSGVGDHVLVAREVH